MKKVEFKFNAVELEMPQDEYVIEKTIEIDKESFIRFISNLQMDYDFIKENKKYMYNKKGVAHCIYVTTKDDNFGVLVDSEGYDYARYTAFLYR